MPFLPKQSRGLVAFIILVFACVLFYGPLFCCFVLRGVAEAKCIFGKSEDKCLWVYLHVRVGSNSLILGCVRV